MDAELGPFEDRTGEGRGERWREWPPGLLALKLLALVDQAREEDVLYLANGEDGLDTTVRALRALAPEVGVLRFPPWDCPPYDRAPPSRGIMGQRMRTLRQLWRPAERPRIVVSTVAAALQRTPPREAVLAACFEVAVKEILPLDEFRRFLLSTGYCFDDRVDEPGEAANHGQVVDIFPADRTRPYRIMRDEDGRITAINPFDPVSQRSNGSSRSLTIGPASEIISDATALGEEQQGERSNGRPPGIEHRMASHYPKLCSLFDALPRILIIAEPGAEQCRLALAEQVADAYETRLSTPRIAEPALPPESMYLTEREWRERIDPHLHQLELGGGAVPDFATERRPGTAFARFVHEQIKAGRRVVLAAEERKRLSRMLRSLKRRIDDAPVVVAGWTAIRGAEAPLLSIAADLDRGFIAPDGTAVIAAADLLGTERPGRAREVGGQPASGTFELEFRPGDVVVHLDHGLGVLEGLQRMQQDGIGTELVRLRYDKDERLLVPVEEIGRIWRYGSEPDAVRLDRLESPSWEKRRAELEEALEDTARGLLELAEQRAHATAPRIEPPRRPFDRIAARFPFEPTADQRTAIEATLADLARETPMDRLIVGDVGFGKTEVALRAAAAAALSGYQVALIAPTTVLARQHLELFRRRFAGTEVVTGHLSSVEPETEVKRVREDAANGAIGIVIGTHAILSEKTRLPRLCLLVIDEEQHFGTEQKRRMREMGQVHVLAMTATPIPRTLQSALTGIQDVSIIATPPVRRQPVRTVIADFDAATVSGALRREYRRGGQSFVVCPRISDLEPMCNRLAEMMPELEIIMAHGKMPAEETDAAVVAFAAGRGDVLVATNIIGTGLDVPRANTILVWRADLFGLSELHQLRGRVGRGSLRGSAYLLTDPEEEIAPATRERLGALAALDRLGAGFAIAARDLDMRGAGDLLGEKQAGHVKLIGGDLYQYMLGQALARLRGQHSPDILPEIHIGLEAYIPEDYVAEPELRLGIYARIARMTDPDEVDAFADEVEDRFGRPPAAMTALLQRARLEQLCRRAFVTRVDGGPNGLALTFAERQAESATVRRVVKRSRGALVWRGQRLMLAREMDTASKRARAAESLLKRLDARSKDAPAAPVVCERNSRSQADQ